MALEIQETFQIGAPIDAVWEFLLTPENVVACMPGATLTQVTDDTSFVGAVKLKIGAVSAQYQGTITYKERDKDSYTVKMLATGNEKGGGTVSGTIITRLAALPDGAGTEIKCASSIDLTGRIMQVGRGMIEGVSAQIIKKYVGNVRTMLEIPRDPAPDTPAVARDGADGAAATTATAVHPKVPAKEDSINVLSVVFKVMVTAITRFFRNLFGIKA